MNRADKSHLLIPTLTHKKGTDENRLQALFKVLIRIACTGFKANIIGIKLQIKKLKFIQNRNKRFKHTNRTL